MSINYILCAAGEGSRFKGKFPHLSKPEILFAGKTMLEWSLESLSIMSSDKIIIITQTKHDLKNKLFNKISDKYRFSTLEWIELDYLTKGQLETAYLTKDLLSMDKSIVIFNSDTYYESRTFMSKVLDDSIEGIIPCIYEENGESWSFCRLEDGEVVEVVEKKRISNWCSVGLYYFKDAQFFIDTAEKMLSSAQEDEYYVAPLYQKYIEQGKKIVIDEVTLFKPMGTPDQIEDFWDIKIDEVVKENISKKVLVVDLDNTITIEESKVSYDSKKPNMAVIQKLKEYHANGFQIIINTARRMRTHKNNEALILRDVGETTLNWLKEHDVPYDGIKFGKPYAENGFYIDDKAIRPDEFVKLSNEEINELVK